jgi:site-specific DNA recombinase
MSEELRANVAERTRSALEMRAKAQQRTGGRPFGYGTDRRPVEPEAGIAREVFARSAAGETMRAIAADLNARGVASPGARWKRGTRRKDGRWLVTALHAILHNPLYMGRVIWNRSSWVKDPDTDVRVCRESRSRSFIRLRMPPSWTLGRGTSCRLGFVATPGLLVRSRDAVGSPGFCYPACCTAESAAASS